MIKTLKDTVELMKSPDYRDRFVAEYKQLAIRYKGLREMLDKWDHDELGFKPTCPRSTYNMQIKAMEDYMAVLEARAVMEGIALQMKLYFQNSRGVERLIAEASNREEVVKEINKFLYDHNYKSYYTRVWEDDGRLVFDVGSHTEFFILEGMNFEEWTNNK